MSAADLASARRAVTERLQQRLDGMRHDLRWLVDLESPSDSPAALTHAAEQIGRWAEDLTGGRAKLIQDEHGPHIVVRLTPAAEGYVLLVGHFDTVWPLGTVDTRPYAEKDGIATGPGVFDMKAGLVQGVWALSTLREVFHEVPDVIFAINSDEEMLSQRSRGLIETLAKPASAALVLEPSADGALKTARKGVGRFRIVVHGRAAHAGVEPWRGISALDELARLILQIGALSDAAVGTTVNVGVAQGGTRPNVVPEWAEAVVDVRVSSHAEAQRVERAIQDLKPSGAGAVLTVEGGMARPPMVRSDASGQIFERARRIAEGMGITLSEAASGGASDGNFCSALGVPVLDGLGAVGGGAHATDEHVNLAEMPLRSALVANLIRELHPAAEDVRRSKGGGGDE